MEAGQYATLNKDVGFKKVVYSKKGTKQKTENAFRVTLKI